MSLNTDRVSIVALTAGGGPTEYDFVVKPSTYKTAYRTVTSDLGVGQTVTFFRLKSNGQPYAVAEKTMDDTDTAVNVFGVGEWRMVRSDNTVEVLISPL